MGQLAMFRLVVLVQICTCVVRGLGSLPDRMHCLAHMSFSEQTGGSTDLARVDEYIDIRAQRSSILLFDGRDGSTEMHYNRLSPNELSGRKSVVFEPSKMSCKTERISDWQLAELRRVAIYLYKSDDLDEHYVDVPIGPSVLLFAVAANADRFKFVRTLFSRSLMTNVNVYSCQLDYSPINSVFRRLKIVLHVSTRGQRRELEAGETLASTSSPDVHLDVKFFGACQLERRRSERVAGKDQGEWDADEFCSPKSGGSLLFAVHYDIVEEYRPGSLIGRQLDEFELEDYNFSREPFMQPVGIGCWSLGTAQNLRDFLTDGQAAGQHVSLSGSYATSNGLKGLSFIAYDATRHLLRWDREGRKSIYDMYADKSYHSGEFSSTNELADTIAGELAVEKCVVLENMRSSSVVGEKDILNQLLALSAPEAHHLGTQIIEHEQFEVYEIGLGASGDVPLLLRTKLERSWKQVDAAKFVTYYIEAPNLLRFIELYEFDAFKKKRRLINRLEFVEFSWALEVEPPNDSQSQASNSNLQLFEMEACLKSGFAQASLVVAFERDTEIGQVSVAQLAKTLQQDKQELTRSIQRFLADTLRVSIMNIIDLRLDISEETRQLLTTSRIVDLRSGLTQLVAMGALYFYDYTSHDYILHYYNMRYSLEECLLDSIYYPKANWFAHCAQLDACVILAPAQQLRAQLKSDRPQSSSDHHEGQRDDLCHVYLVRYSTMDRTIQEVSAVDRVDTNQRHLAGKRFDFEVGSHKDAETGTVHWGYLYRAQIVVLAYKRLNAIGARLGNDLAILSGLRYSTKEDEPSAQNSNQLVRLDRSSPVGAGSKSSGFIQCQLSCQLDEFCGSFSFCTKPKSSKSSSRSNLADCVLSTLHLTKERAAKLVAAANQVKRDETRFQLGLGGEFVMFKDDACSLHPRDFVTDYKVIKTFGREHQDANNGLHLEGGPIRRSGPNQMSLDECAGLSFEKTFGCQFNRQTNFTYCPLDSLCVVSGDEADEQLALAEEGICMKYERNPARAYVDMMSTHMEVVTSRRAAKKAPDQTKPPSAKDLLDQFDIEDPASPVRTFWGLSEEDCARECSLHKTECLAFDSCRNMGKTLCLLYSIRSPLSRRGAYLPLTKREQEFFKNGEVKLASSLICDHFHLRPGYFEVRLRGLLDRQDDNLDKSKPPSNLEQLENNIETANEKLAAQELRTLIDNPSPELSPDAVDISSSWIHWLELISGLFIGVVLVSFQQQVIDAAMTIYTRVRHRRNDADERGLVNEEQL